MCRQTCAFQFLFHFSPGVCLWILITFALGWCFIYLLFHLFYSMRFLNTCLADFCTFASFGQYLIIFQDLQWTAISSNRSFPMLAFPWLISMAFSVTLQHKGKQVSFIVQQCILRKQFLHKTICKLIFYHFLMLSLLNYFSQWLHFKEPSCKLEDFPYIL